MSTRKWSYKSDLQRRTLSPNLQRFCDRMLETFDMDISIAEGYRSNERQEEMYRTGKSKARAGQSKHNSYPSKAVDLYCLPVEWPDAKGLSAKDKARINANWDRMGKHGMAVAKELGIKLRWGGDWDRDGLSSDEKFLDKPHFEEVD